MRLFIMKHQCVSVIDALNCFIYRFIFKDSRSVGGVATLLLREEKEKKVMRQKSVFFFF